MSLAHSSTLIFATLIDADQNWRREQVVRHADQLFNSRCVRDDDLRAAIIETVFDSLWTEKRKQGQRDRAQPIGGKMGDRGFRALRQQNADPVTPRESRPS